MVFADIWLVIRKRRMLLVCISLGMALLAAGYGYMRGKQYTAVGEIQIQPGASSDLKTSLTSALGGLSSLDDIMESDTRILSSETLLLAVIRTLKLQDNPDFLGSQIKADNAIKGGAPVALLHGDLNDSFVRVKLVQILRQHLTVNRVPRTQMITISCVGSSPQLAADIVNALESEFIKNNFVVHYGNKQQVSNWLTGQIDDLRGVVQTSQDKMVDLQKKLGISVLDPNHSVIVQEISNLEKSATDAAQQRVLAQARYRILASLPPDQILDAPTPLGSDGTTNLLASLRAQRAADNAELARLRPVYGPNYPQVKQLSAHVQAVNNEIAGQEQRIVNQAKDAVNMATASEDQAKQMLQGRVHELYGQRDDLVQYELLTQEYESNRQMYEGILAQLREAAVDAGLESADISVVDLASLPIGPSSMPVRKIAGLGLLGGFFIGLVVAIVVEKMDTRVRDSKHIQELLDLPGLAIVPQTSWKGKEEERESKVGPEMLWDPRSSFAESLRVFRTSIQLSSAARQSRVIAVTSCQPAEGKSTIATNLAAALAQAGKKVVVVDTDMRRPSIYWRLGLTAKKGLSEFLTGNESLAGILQTHQALPTLDLIPSGFSPPLPADLLASEQMKQLVKTLRERYEYVIFDTPPVLSVTDPLIVASQADGVVLVIRQGYCTRAMLTRAAEIFHDVELKVYGFVLNGVDASLPEYYGYLGYYSYDYRK
jgi:capsular exopolysaccharide synthesis family protein